MQKLFRYNLREQTEQDPERFLHKGHVDENYIWKIKSDFIYIQFVGL